MFSAWWFSWYAVGRAENATTNHRQGRRRQWPAGTRATGQWQAKVDVRGWHPATKVTTNPRWWGPTTNVDGR